MLDINDINSNCAKTCPRVKNRTFIRDKAVEVSPLFDTIL